MNRRSNRKRDKQKVNRSEDHVDTGAENIVDLPNVIGGTCHEIANRLEAMKGHTFTKKADVKLVPDITFDHLRDNLETEVT